MTLLPVTALAFACNSGGAATPTATRASATAVASATPAASPTPSPLADPSADGSRIYETTRQLAAGIGPRVAGTDGEKAARDYLEPILRSYGYDVSEQAFSFDATAYLPARVDLAPDAYPAIAFRGSAAATASGPLVAAGIGRAEDIPAGARGKVVVMRRGGIPFSAMVQAAVGAGAAGVVIANNAAGNLVGETDPVQLPVVSVSQSTGDRLFAAAAASPVVKITVSPPKGTAHNIIAKPPGVTACTTLTGAHYDSVAVTGGADDNASGAAAVVEVARMAAAHRLAGANCFVLFSAEEFGLFGSKAYVDALSPAELTGLRAMLNLDVVGVAGELGLVGDTDLVEQARVDGQRAGVQATASTLPPGASSDHASFQAKGVPVVMFTRPDDLIHTQQDAMPRIEAASLRDAATIAYATLAALAGR